MLLSVLNTTTTSATGTLCSQQQIASVHVPIENVPDLHEHLRLALKIELATIPPYLYAMYSIENQSSDAALLIRSIVAEEMLHAALVSNVLLAVGGRPDFRNPDLVPSYPMFLPHHTPPLQLGLRPCSPSLVRDVFMTLEQPETHHPSPDPDRFETLGQFYHALEQGLEHLDGAADLFADTQLGSQMATAAYYAPVKFDADDSGGLSAVTDLASASSAIEVIVHQGEGVSLDRWADPDHRELTHFHKLLQISEGISPLGAIRPLPDNPKTAHYPHHLRPVSELFNAAYRYLFHVLDGLFSPGDDKSASVGTLYLMMNSVLSTIAHYLVESPCDDSLNAAPTFELRRFESEDPTAELTTMARECAVDHPRLNVVVEALDLIEGGT